MAGTSSFIYEDLKNKIISGELLPSSALKEQDLADNYGVSRNTIKKVLLALEKDGLVAIEPNKGANVRSYSISEIKEALDLRATLEQFITYRSVPNLTQEEIFHMEVLLQDMDRHIKQNNLKEITNANHAFHRIISDACPNRTAVEILVSLKNKVSKYNTKTLLIPGRAAESLQEHLEILNAIKNHDAELAAAMMARHIENVRKVFEDNYRLLF